MGLNPGAISKTILDSVTFHAAYDDSVLDALRFARSSGFRGVQLAMDAPHLAVDRMTAVQLDEIAAYRADNDLLLSLQAPNGIAPLHASAPELTRGAMSYLGRLVNAAERVGAHAVVVSLAEPPSFPADDGTGRMLPASMEPQLRGALRDNLMRLAGLGLGRCAVCIENRSLNEMMCELLEPLVSKGFLSLCWDIARAHGEATESPMARLFADYAYRIRVVNLHDVRGDLSHAALGTGCVDLAAAIEWLYPLDVREWCVQVWPRETALQSLETLKRVAMRVDAHRTSDG